MTKPHRACIALAVVALLGSACARRAPELVRRPDHPPPALLIENVSVLDVANGESTPGRDVLVEGGRIRAIRGRGEIAKPPGGEVIGGEGATLLPGLIDMHGHLGNDSAPSWVGRFPDPDRNLRSYLYCGVTTVLDPADLSTQAFDRRDRVARGELLGPRIFAAGPMVTAPGGHPVAIMQHLAPWWIRWYLIPRAAFEVDSAAAARRKVAEITALGADVVKLAVDRIPEQAPRIRKEVLVAAVEEAKRHGVRAVAHVGTLADAVDAADAGVAAWMHGVYKERIPDERIAALAAYRIPMVATMVVFESYALTGRGKREPTALEREIETADVLETFDHIPAGDPTITFFRETLDHLYAERQSGRDNVRRLHEAGVTILAGSDAQIGVFPGAGLHRELALLVEAGLTPAEAIRAATLDAARFLANGKEPDFGVVAEGKTADLVLVEGHPTRDIEALSRIRAVIQGGVPLERRAITH